jgi:hypothetical protein
MRVKIAASTSCFLRLDVLDDDDDGDDDAVVAAAAAAEDVELLLVEADVDDDDDDHDDVVVVFSVVDELFGAVETYTNQPTNQVSCKS